MTKLNVLLVHYFVLPYNFVKLNFVWYNDYKPRYHWHLEVGPQKWQNFEKGRKSNCFANHFLRSSNKDKLKSSSFIQQRCDQLFDFILVTSYNKTNNTTNNLWTLNCPPSHSNSSKQVVIMKKKHFSIISYMNKKILKIRLKLWNSIFSLQKVIES